MTRVSPKVDVAFKKLFGVEENKDLLISLINSIVSQEDQVSEVTILNPYNSKRFVRDKLSILDIKAKGVDNDKLFNIEIQISDEADYDKRALYYWAKLYTDQLKSAEDYSSLSKAIGIHILNFTSIVGTNDYHSIFKIIEEKSKLHFFQDLELHTIELNKFSKNQETLAELAGKVKTALDRWVAFLSRNELLQANNLPKELDDLNIKKAINVIDEMSFTDEEREAYENHLKWLRIESNTLKKQYDKGIEKGRVEGLKEGLEKGRVEGIEQIAINMLRQKLDQSLISSVTGLSADEISRLAEFI
jgi:predicted transposase/invertase (TIGR01784 family)